MKEAVRLVAPIVFILMAAALSAQPTRQEPVAPDRPGVGTPPSLVPRNRFQFETGSFFERSHVEGTTTDVTSWNQSLLRFGWLSFAEIRLATEYTRTGVKKPDGTSTVSGFGPLVLGTKIGLLQGGGAIPKTALLANFIIPGTGLEDYRVEKVAPSVVLLFQNPLTDRLSLGYNLGLIWNGESPQPTTFYAINLGLSLTRKLSLFVENFGFFGSAGSDLFVDAGFAYLLIRKIQLDFAGGIHTKGGDRDTRLSLGFSWLIN